MKQSRPRLLSLWVTDYGYNIRVLLVFIALQLLLAYSPFGFIIMSTISMSTLFLGVLIAALWGGPIMGAVMGAIFGLASMWEASVTAVSVRDLIFSPWYSGNPLGSVTVALIPRILFGVTAGVIYLLVLKIKNTKNRIPMLILATVLLDRLQSMFTYFFIDKVFHLEGAFAGKAFIDMFSAKRIIEYIIAALVIICVYYYYDKVLSKRYYWEFMQMKAKKLSLPKWKTYFTTIFMALVIFVTLIHLWDRQEIVLYQIDDLVPGQVSKDRMLQVMFQFIVATFSAIYISLVVSRHSRNVEEIKRIQSTEQLIEEKRNAEKYAEHSVLDELTKVYNRKGMENIIVQEDLEHKAVGYLMVDIDSFKEINDTYGHDVGDEVLKIISSVLVKVFDTKWVFRVGGDEFVVLIPSDITKCWNELCEKIEQVYKEVNSQIKEGFSLTMSMGAYYCQEGYSSDVYRKADEALYETKRRGKAGCSLIGADNTILEYWKDGSVKPAHKRDMELKNGNLIKIVFSETDEFKPRLFCDEGVKNMVSIRRYTTPEECYKIWYQRMNKEGREEADMIKKMISKTRTFSFEYMWNHPTRGIIQIMCGGTGEVSDGVGIILAFYRIVTETDAT